MKGMLLVNPVSHTHCLAQLALMITIVKSTPPEPNLLNLLNLLNQTS